MIDHPSSAFADLQGHMPPRGSVYRELRIVRDLAQRGMALAMDGPECDVPLALTYLNKIKAELGVNGEID